jgi:hypothetical protein
MLALFDSTALRPGTKTLAAVHVVKDRLEGFGMTLERKILFLLV